MSQETKIDESRPELTLADLRPDDVLTIDQVKQATGRKDVPRWRYERLRNGRTDLPPSLKFGIGRQARVVYLRRDIEQWLNGYYA